MKGKLHASTVGLSLGALFALWHAAWALLVAGGFAQSLLDWVFSLHFLDNPYVVTTFSLQTAVILVIVTFAVGYAMGWVFATAWNWVVKK